MVHVEREIDGRKIHLYHDGRNLELLKGFYKAVHQKNTSVVIVYDGFSGLGKTTFANQVGITLDPNFNLNKVFYNCEDFLDGLAKAKKGDYILFDEAMLLSSRSALNELNKAIVQAMSMIRSKNLFVAFCINAIFDLDRNLALSRANILYNVYGKSLVDRGNFKAFFTGSDGFNRLKALYLNGKRGYSYATPKANFIGRFTKEFVVNEKKYERQKQNGINKFLKAKGKSNLVGARDHRDKLIGFLRKNDDFSAKQIAAIVGCTERTIQKIAKKMTQEEFNKLMQQYAVV